MHSYEIKSEIVHSTGQCISHRDQREKRCKGCSNHTCYYRGHPGMVWMPYSCYCTFDPSSVTSPLPFFRFRSLLSTKPFLGFLISIFLLFLQHFTLMRNDTIQDGRKVSSILVSSLSFRECPQDHFLKNRQDQKLWVPHGSIDTVIFFDPMIVAILNCMKIESCKSGNIMPRPAPWSGSGARSECRDKYE